MSSYRFSALVLLIVFVFQSFSFAESEKPFYALRNLVSVNGTGPHLFQNHRIGLFYFGYTNCLKSCPLALAALKAALQRMPQEKQKHFLPVFVSLDSDADEPQAAQTFVANFFDAGLGLSGSSAAVAEALRFFRTSAQLVRQEDPALAPVFSHSNFFFVLNERGKFVGQVPAEASPSQLKEQLLSVLHDTQQ